MKEVPRVSATMATARRIQAFRLVRGRQPKATGTGEEAEPEPEAAVEMRRAPEGVKGGRGEGRGGLRRSEGDRLLCRAGVSAGRASSEMTSHTLGCTQGSYIPFTV